MDYLINSSDSSKTVITIKAKDGSCQTYLSTISSCKKLLDILDPIDNSIELNITLDLANQIIDYLRAYPTDLTGISSYMSSLGLLNVNECDYVHINVGGKIYCIDKDYLENKLTYFKKFFEWNKSNYPDYSGVVIDRSPRIFQNVLKYISGVSFSELNLQQISNQIIIDELIFYGYQNVFDLSLYNEINKNKDPEYLIMTQLFEYFIYDDTIYKKYNSDIIFEKKDDNGNSFYSINVSNRIELVHIYIKNINNEDDYNLIKNTYLFLKYGSSFVQINEGVKFTVINKRLGLIEISYISMLKKQNIYFMLNSKYRIDHIEYLVSGKFINELYFSKNKIKKIIQIDLINKKDEYLWNIKNNSLLFDLNIFKEDCLIKSVHLSSDLGYCIDNIEILKDNLVIAKISGNLLLKKKYKKMKYLYNFNITLNDITYPNRRLLLDKTVKINIYFLTRIEKSFNLKIKGIFKGTKYIDENDEIIRDSNMVQISLV